MNIVDQNINLRDTLIVTDAVMKKLEKNILSRCRSKLLILKCVEQWPNN